jgi:Rrf2 family iron-sulfur cluster assembly transcriptional regulator
MDLSLTRRADYAVRAALYLAEAWPDGRPRKIREVASAMALPRSYTPEVLGILARAQLAVARAGPTGGYRLSRRPADISLLEVVEAAEGPLALAHCTLRGGPCRWEDACPVHSTWVRASQALRDSLGSTSLEDVVQADATLGGTLDARV